MAHRLLAPLDAFCRSISESAAAAVGGSHALFIFDIKRSSGLKITSAPTALEFGEEGSRPHRSVRK